MGSSVSVNQCSVQLLDKIHGFIAEFNDRHMVLALQQQCDTYCGNIKIGEGDCDERTKGGNDGNTAGQKGVGKRKEEQTGIGNLSKTYLEAIRSTIVIDRKETENFDEVIGQFDGGS